jgi:co-chaperonin GroES (HSP10)
MAIQNLYPEIKPSLNLDFANTKALDPRVTFSRASTATYYGTETAKAEENLFLRSQEFNNNYWSKSGVTITADSTTAPDGTTTADFMAISSGSTAGRVGDLTISVAAGDCIISAFAKPNGKDYLVIYEELLDGTIKQTWFNVSTGTIGTTDAGHTAVITDAGNGWYRCSVKVTVNASRTDAVLFRLADTDGSTTVTDSGGLYLWGAQVEQRSAVTAYTPTTDQPITNYIPVLQTASANVARFDHNPVTGESLGLLVEEQRTNLLVRSEEFDNAAWTKARASIVANTIVAPDGTLTADKLVANTDTNTHVASQSLSLASGTVYTASLYAKQGETRYVRFGFGGAAFAAIQIAFFDLQGGVVVTTSGTVTTSITSVGNGWWRLSVTATATSTATGEIAILPSLNGTSSSFTGNGYSGIYIWGAQLEASTKASSYIKTVASQVTRSKDTENAIGLGQLGEGTFYIEAQADTSDDLIDSGTTTFNAPDANLNKIAVAYDSASTRTSINGGTVSSAAGTQGGVDIEIGKTVNGHIRKVALYPKKLTDANIQALTS